MGEGLVMAIKIIPSALAEGLALGKELV